MLSGHVVVRKLVLQVVRNQHLLGVLQIWIHDKKSKLYLLTKLNIFSSDLRRNDTRFSASRSLKIASDILLRWSRHLGLLSSQTKTNFRHLWGSRRNCDESLPLGVLMIPFYLGSLYLKNTGSLYSSVMPGRQISSKHGCSNLRFDWLVFIKLRSMFTSAGVTAISVLFLNTVTTVWSMISSP